MTPTRGRIAYADGPDGPLPDPALIAEMAGLEPAEAELVLGWVVREAPWLAAPAVATTTLMVGAGTRRAVAAGAVAAVPTRLSAIPGLLAGRLRPDVVVVGAWADGTRWRLAGSPGWALGAVAAAGRVVIERWPGPAPAHRPLLPEAEIVAVYDRAEPPDAAPANRLGPEHERIGRLVADLIPDGATIQWGPGAVGAAVVEALDRPVAVRSGLVTDELAGLAARGLMEGRATSAYLWGGADLGALVTAGRLRLAALTETHDLTALSAIERFVAVNTALQVGLDGAVNVETAGGRVVAGPGGHPDFATGASRSPGGLSIVALPATAGARSGIVARPEVVSTARCDVDVVVTEHGVADLRHVPPAERAERLIAVAAPEHRGDLRAQLAAGGPP